MSWTDCIVNDNYEICNEYPFAIRRKKDGYVMNEWITKQGYVQVKLQGEYYYKHRIIAMQFIPNPDNLPCIDHVNRIRTDNRIENLRFVSYSTNNINRASTLSVEYNYVDDIPDESIVVNDYGKYQFEDYYFDEETDKFYFFNGQQYRELHINTFKNGSKYVHMITTENKKVNVCYTKFKKLYDLI